ncbi:NUDIX domain-containing protein [Flectobacillus sp. DC10W]|uniref:NUDIX domain-containing protein n=1 Tax=Flectobacillus longus TaxID=2984207 RepID=A0ABT6YTB7_9BACT|nr:NUDIX domain-containing protein [Flectobacillus longus]MDI9866338.1 NUDIX domain-containing protein [Flectobacillus longus]
MDIINCINQVSIDCVIFGYENHQLKVLISKSRFKGDFYSLPSGFIFQNEDIEDAAQRVVRERTGIENIYLKHFNVFGKVGRKRQEFLDKLIALNYVNQEEEYQNSDRYKWFINRFISIGYYSLVDINSVIPQTSELDESIGWYNIHDVPELIMDYNQVLQDAYHCLKSDINELSNIYNLLPEQFTMKEIQDIYETILEKTFIRTNFQKKILELDVLERLEKKFTGAKNKAPYLYRVKK